MSLNQVIRKAVSLPGVAEVLALVGGAVFLLQSWHFAHIQESILDEGMYLVKGFLFATGRYIPFQPNGPWTNQMPLSFLIPGIVQVVFGPGLRTGRYLSIAFAGLMLLGLWLISRRLGGRWWAAAAVWMIALNGAYARTYSLAVPQALIICMLMWILVLVIDEKAHLWQLVLASILAGLMILTRHNMTPVLPLLLIYIFWQFGLRAGVWSTVAGIITVLIGHAVYWPGILQLWAAWIPEKLSPFLDAWRIKNAGSTVWHPNFDTHDQITSLLDGVRFNFVAFVAWVGFGILVFLPKQWKTSFHYKSVAFLTALSAILVAVHAWAALFSDYCAYCFPGYLMYFSPILILLVIFTLQSWKPGPAKMYAVLAAVVTLLISTGAGYGAFQEIGTQLVEFPIPRFKASQMLGGTVPLWGILENGLGIAYKTSLWLVPTLAGLGVGLIVLLLSWVAYRTRWLQGGRFPDRFGLAAISLLVFLGAVLSPTRTLSGLDQKEACQSDVIASIEQVGMQLAKAIPPGKQVYWQGSLSAAPLLYLPKAEIYPPQLNDGYSYHAGGNTQELQRFGLWNEVIRGRWLEEADFIIILEDSYNQDWKNFFETGGFEELPHTASTYPCEKNMGLRIFRRDK